MVAAVRVSRPQHGEIRGKPHPAACIPGSQLDVRDRLVDRRERVYGKVGGAFQQLVWADLAEGFTTGEGGRADDIQSYYRHLVAPGPEATLEERETLEIGAH